MSRPRAPIMAHVTILPQDHQLQYLMTILRDAKTQHREFSGAAEKVAAQLLTVAINHIPITTHTITTPTGSSFDGVEFTKSICGVSILRAGASMEQALRNTWMGPLRFGKLLIQRDETTYKPKLFYSKLPPNVHDDIVFLLEPMLATGGSVTHAIESLISFGISEESIVLVNILASTHGLGVVTNRFQRLKVVTAAVDEKLTPKNYIDPGLGDFGDRYYGTLY